MRALRYDYVRLDAIQRTPQGGMRIPSTLTRTGVFEYRKPDGSITRELRHPDEVFHKDAVESMANAPLTIGHVAQVTPENWGAVAVGHVIGTPKQDGKFLSADCQINRSDAIKQIEGGSLKELSCGYEVELDPTPGEYNGEKYDSIQRNIRGNHVALLPAGAGRAGPEVKLRMDSKDGFPGGVAFWRFDTGEPSDAHETKDEAPTQAEREEMNKSEFGDPENKKYPLDTPEHVRAAASYVAVEHNAGRLSDAKFEEIQARINKAKAKHGIGEENKDSRDAYPVPVSANTESPKPVVETKTDSTDVLLGRIEALNAANAELQKRVDGLPVAIEAAATARADLLSQVNPHMPKDKDGNVWKSDGKSEGQIVREAVSILCPTVKLDGKSDDFVRGIFEQALTGAQESRSKVASVQAPLHPARLDGDMDADMDELEMKNKAAKKKSMDAWKTAPKGAMTRDSLRK